MAGGSKLFSFQMMKGHPSLYPLALLMGVAVTGASSYLLRLATKNPDVRFTNKNSDSTANVNWPINKQHKFSFFDPRTKDYPNMKHPEERPDIERMWREYKATRA